MKRIKTKLSAAIVMVVISALMLTGVSFAWYTLSTNPEVTNIKAKVAANENLEIALDKNYVDQAAVDTASSNANVQGGAQGSTSDNPYTWGNLVDLDYAFGINGINDRVALKPVKYVLNNNIASLQFPYYGLDGRISNMETLTGFDFSDLNSVTISSSSPTDNTSVTAYGQKSTNNTSFDALSVTYWIRSNMNTYVSLSDATKRAFSSEDSSAADSDPNGVTGDGSYIRFPSTGTGAAAQNTKLFNWLTTGKLTIQFDVINVSNNNVSETFYAYPSATAVVEEANNYYTYKLELSSLKTSLTETNISLTANTAKTIKMYLYLDGILITNADAFLDDLDGLELNIQFAGTDVNDAMDASAAPASAS